MSSYRHTFFKSISQISKSVTFNGPRPLETFQEDLDHAFVNHLWKLKLLVAWGFFFLTLFFMIKHRDGSVDSTWWVFDNRSRNGAEKKPSACDTTLWPVRSYKMYEMKGLSDQEEGWPSKTEEMCSEKYTDARPPGEGAFPARVEEETGACICISSWC